MNPTTTHEVTVTSVLDDRGMAWGALPDGTSVHIGSNICLVRELHVGDKLTGFLAYTPGYDNPRLSQLTNTTTAGALESDRVRKLEALIKAKDNAIEELQREVADLTDQLEEADAEIEALKEQVGPDPVMLLLTPRNAGAIIRDWDSGGVDDTATLKAINEWRATNERPEVSLEFVLDNAWPRDSAEHTLKRAIANRK